MSTFVSESCIEDFEDQRGTYEAVIYGSFIVMVMIIAIPVRCCFSSAIRDMWAGRLAAGELSERDQRTATIFLRVASVISPLPILAILYAYVVLFPVCSCADGISACDICTLRIDGIPFGSCYKAATGFGIFAMLFSVLIFLGVRKRLNQVQGFTPSYSPAMVVASTEMV